MYSVKRLFALHEYCASASRTRVFAILVFFCSPPLLIMTILDSIPLQDPSDGWRANKACWLRIAIDTTLVCAAILAHAQAVVPEIMLTARQNGAILCGVSLGGTAILLTLAECWMFPIPFTFAVAAVPFVAILNVLVVLTLGLGDRKRLRKFFRFTGVLTVHAAMLVVYPTYNAVFLSLDGHAQLAFVLVLPGIKVCFRYATEKMYPIDDDQLTAMVASVDIFDALYMTKCMQSGGTLAVGFAIIAVDTVHNFVGFRRLNRQTRMLLATLQARRQLLGKDTRQQHDEQQDLLAWAVGVLAGHTKRLKSLSYHSNTRYSLSVQVQRLLGNTHVRGRAVSSPVGRAKNANPISAVVPASLQRSGDEPIGSSQNELAIAELVHLLHVSESVVVVEYIETVVPVIYAVCIAVLFHLPNAQYYQDMHGFTQEKLHKLLTNILVYAFLELLSLLYVHHTMQRHFGVSLVYQLAFALESEWKMFLSEFTAWILLIFQFLLIHSGKAFLLLVDWLAGDCCRVICKLMMRLSGLLEKHPGVDFTFQFAWGKVRHGAVPG